MNSIVPVVALFAILLSTGCAHRSRTYGPTDEFWASGVFPIPREFRNGTATLPDVHAWSASLLNWNQATAYPPLKSLEVDIDADAVPELFVCQPAEAGNGGNSYLAFQRTQRGFRYLGRLGFGGIWPVAPDAQRTARVLTTWKGGGANLGVTLWQLTGEGFSEIARCTLAAGDSGTAEGNRLAELLFESEMITDATLQTVFTTP